MGKEDGRYLVGGEDDAREGEGCQNRRKGMLVRK